MCVCVCFVLFLSFVVFLYFFFINIIKKARLGLFLVARVSYFLFSFLSGRVFLPIQNHSKEAPSSAYDSLFKQNAEGATQVLPSSPSPDPSSSAYASLL